MDLNSLIDELERSIPFAEAQKPTISESSVGWHIEHSLLVIERILTALKASDAENYKPRFNPVSQLVLLFGKIKRGRAKAPKVVLPNEFTKSSLQDRIHSTRALVENSNDLKANQHFTHPYLGVLNVKKTRKFLVIHTKHHLAIIRDILAD